MINPEEKANDLLNRCLGICSPARFGEYNSSVNLERARQAALFLVSEISQAAQDKEYWAKVTWTIVNTKKSVHDYDL